MLAIPLRRSGIDWELDDQGATLVRSSTHQIYRLNPVGIFVWDLADGVTSCEDIVDAMTQEFEIDIDRAWEDLETFMDEMVREDLIVLSNQEAAPAG